MGNCLNRPSSKKSAKKYQFPSNNLQQTPSNTTTQSKSNGTAHDLRKPKLDPKDFIISNQSNQRHLKQLGSNGGKADFIIEDCIGCDILLLDWSLQLTIDSCRDCVVFAGLVEGSVFIRNCVNCTIWVGCAQFRMRDCENCQCFLHVSSQPVIETSRNLSFGCFRGTYPGILEHFQAARLSIWTNEWSQVHNFTKSGGSRPDFQLCSDYDDRIRSDVIERRIKGSDCGLDLVSIYKSSVPFLISANHLTNSSLLMVSISKDEQVQIESALCQFVNSNCKGQVYRCKHIHSDILRKMQNCPDEWKLVSDAVAIQFTIQQLSQQTISDLKSKLKQHRNLLLYVSENITADSTTVFRNTSSFN